MTGRPFLSKLCPILGAILLAPLVVLYVTQAIWLGSLAAPLPWMVGHPAAVGLFWLLFSSLSLTLYGFTRRFFWACLPGTVALVLLAYVSRIKRNVNGSPLQLSVFTMVGGLGDIAGYASSQLLPSAAAVAAAVLALLLLVLLARKGKALRISVTTGFILGSLALGLLCSACYPGSLQKAALALDETCRSQLDRNDRMGVALGLYAAWCQRVQVERHQADLDTAELAGYFLEDANTHKPPLALDETPDIIFITSESFFDVTRLPGLTFEADPLPVFHSLSETCTNGRFLSNTCGGGTGWVEMELFTGLTSFFLKEGDTLSTLEETVYETLPTTVRLLAQLGYATSAIHAHNDALYNRDVIYPAIGFQETLFIDDFLTPVEIKGTYASDETFAREIIARYEARDPTAPCFLYGMSMENHQAYPAGKYPEPSGYPARSEALSQKDLAILDSLVMGLHDADQSLGMLVDYFSQVDRPVLLVFVGDHLPSLNLDDGSSLYTRLGVSPTEDASQWDAETLAEMLSTDYLIWTNYETQVLPDGPESCTFLGLHTLTRAGVPLNSCFRWLEETIGGEMLLTRNGFFADAAGNGAYEVPAAAQETLDRYAALEWELVYGTDSR